eukprot:g11.t1
MDKRKLKLARRDENADSTGMGQARDTVKRIFAEANALGPRVPALPEPTIFRIRSRRTDGPLFRTDEVLCVRPVREHEYVADILNVARPIAPKWSLQPRRVAGSGAEGARDKCFRDSFDRPAEPVYYGYSRKHGGHMKRIPQFTLKYRLKLRHVTEPSIITPSFLGTERFSEKIIMPGLGAPDQPPIGHYGVADPKPSYVKKGIAMMPGFAVKSRTPMVIKGGSTDWLNPGPGHYDIPIRNDDPSRPHQPEFTLKATASNEWEKFVSESASQPGPGAYEIPTMLGLTHPTAILTSRARILCPIRNELRAGEC